MAVRHLFFIPAVWPSFSVGGGERHAYPLTSRVVVPEWENLGIPGPTHGLEARPPSWQAGQWQRAQGYSSVGARNLQPPLEGQR